MLLEEACPGRARDPVSFILILLLYGLNLEPEFLAWDLCYLLQGIPTIPEFTVQCLICFLIVVL